MHRQLSIKFGGEQAKDDAVVPGAVALLGLAAHALPGKASGGERGQRGAV
jgi:hypothetical protein